MPAVMRLGLAHQPHRHQAVERARVTAAPGSIVETGGRDGRCNKIRSEEHTSELQSRLHLVCRLLLEKKKPADDGTLAVVQLSVGGALLCVQADSNATPPGAGTGSVRPVLSVDDPDAVF